MSKSKSDLIDDLIDAAEENDLERLKLCLGSKRIDANAANDYARTALHGATANGHLKIVQYLLKMGATADVMNDDNETPLCLAKEAGHADIIRLLEMAEHIQSTPEWSLAGSSKLIHIETCLPASRQLTEIFNFESRERQIITENLRTNTETVFPPASFDSLPSEMIENILAKFRELGGTADTEFVMNGTARLQKTTASSQMKNF